MAASSAGPKWEVDLLRHTWNSLFDEKYYRVHNNDIDIQALLLLLSSVFDRVQQLGNRLANTTASYEKVVKKLEEDKETLEKEILKNSECKKCCELEMQLAEVSKKANEAQNRMNSIAKILCLGSLESGDTEKRNTALSIVSQMLLDSSPKRKRRRSQTKNSPIKENMVIAASSEKYTENLIMKDEISGGNANVVPDTISHSPLKPINVLPTTSTKNRSRSNFVTTRHLSTSVNLPVHSSSKVVSPLKKNLSAGCISQKCDNDIVVVSPTRTKKGLSFNIDLERFVNKTNKTFGNSTSINDTALDATLLEYVKDSRTELDKIWFDNDKTVGTFDKSSQNLCKGLEEILPVNQIIEATPLREDNSKKKRADFWLLKEKRELCNKSRSLDGKNLRQTRLKLGTAQKAVDISKLNGFNGGMLQKYNISQDDDIIPSSPGSPQASGDGQAENDSTTNTIDFQPLASSTQRPTSVNDVLTAKKRVTSKEEPGCIYKRDAVRKKSERAKLPGWDCDECAKYYSAMSLNKSEVKARLNACSRHRDKFNPNLNETPPGFWNPLFPDTQECRDKGMYVSIHIPRDENKK